MSTARIAGFLESIGLAVREAAIPQDTFLPGIIVEGGVILMDPERLRYPGDLLHEAGHLAVLPAPHRAEITGPVGDDLGNEIAAIAWSWAALVHLGLDPAVVFHEGGYRGHSEAFIENFSAGHTPGVPLLEWYGLTSAAEYPRMKRWLRE